MDRLRLTADRYRGEPTVTVVDWPRERHVVEHLASLGLPRLLLVAEGAEPPYVDVLLADWLRLPAEERDLASPAGRTAPAGGAGGDPRIRWRRSPLVPGGLGPLSPIEYTVATVLVERFGRLVSDDDLAARAWTGSPPGGAALRVHLTRLRRRIEPIGLEIRTVRSRGHVMQAVGPNHAFAG